MKNKRKNSTGTTEPAPAITIEELKKLNAFKCPEIPEDCSLDATLGEDLRSFIKKLEEENKAFLQSIRGLAEGLNCQWSKELLEPLAPWDEIKRTIEEADLTREKMIQSLLESYNGSLFRFLMRDLAKLKWKPREQAEDDKEAELLEKLPLFQEKAEKLRSFEYQDQETDKALTEAFMLGAMYGGVSAYQIAVRDDDSLLILVNDEIGDFVRSIAGYRLARLKSLGIKDHNNEISKRKRVKKDTGEYKETDIAYQLAVSFIKSCQQTGSHRKGTSGEFADWLRGIKPETQEDLQQFNLQQFEVENMDENAPSKGVKIYWQPKGGKEKSLKWTSLRDRLSQARKPSAR